MEEVTALSAEVTVAKDGVGEVRKEMVEVRETLTVHQTEHGEAVAALEAEVKADHNVLEQQQVRQMKYEKKLSDLEITGVGSSGGGAGTGLTQDQVHQHIHDNLHGSRIVRAQGVPTKTFFYRFIIIYFQLRL